ncbi:hypothetical protein AVEN_170850-1 [Araneus ventricosus]|uniref:Uncharacterized protein n=1 Tax=Araneus ventricosus TaxID=182803 RepID=A0A4Y2P4C0_ARAVE|nr:hypothetical protein AVEN_170850-1 [Araneus ventricosus]
MRDGLPIFRHGQMTRTKPELAPNSPNFRAAPACGHLIHDGGFNEYHIHQYIREDKDNGSRELAYLHLIRPLGLGDIEQQHVSLAAPSGGDRHKSHIQGSTYPRYATVTNNNKQILKSKQYVEV